MELSITTVVIAVALFIGNMLIEHYLPKTNRVKANSILGLIGDLFLKIFKR